MIEKSNLTSHLKTLLVACKLILYLVIYINILGCAWWICISDNLGKQYWRDYSINGYISADGEVLKDVQGN